MEQLLANFSGKTRRAVLNGRDHLVAPLTLIVPGVLNGSKGALYYPEEEIGKDPTSWNGMPIVVRHPTDNGSPVSARNPDVYNRQWIGTVMNTTSGDKLTAEGWFDIAMTRQVDNRILQALEAGKPIELSTGLFTDNSPAPKGATHNGKAYQYIARNYRPDHLAILPDEKGACSLKDGCGVLVNEDQTILQKIAGFFGLTAPVDNQDWQTKTSLYKALNERGWAADTYIVEANAGTCLYQQNGKTYRAKYATENDATNFTDDEHVEVNKIGGYWRSKKETIQNQDDHSDSSDTPVEGAPDMAKLTDNERAQLINGLCVNCDCLKAEDDKKVLNTLSDDALKGLKANAEKTKTLELVANSAREAFGDEAKDVALNAMPAFIKEKMDKKKAAEGDDEDDDEDEDAMKEKMANLKKNKKGKEAAVPAANRLTAEEQEDLAFARQEKNRQKQVLVNKLTCNLEDGDAKTRLVKNLSTKPLSELQDLAMLAPTVNQQQYAPEPSYFGAAVPPTINRNRFDQDDVLPVPTTNWEEEARLQRREPAAV